MELIVGWADRGWLKRVKSSHPASSAMAATQTRSPVDARRAGMVLWGSPWARRARPARASAISAPPKPRTATVAPALKAGSDVTHHPPSDATTTADTAAGPGG